MAQMVLESATVYDFLFRTTADGLLIADANMKLTLLNPAAAVMLGVTAENVVGKKPQEVFSKNHLLLNLFLRSGNQKLTVRMPRRRIAVGIAETLESGERVVLLQDITESHNLETRREQLSKSIAHDLRNPLAAIDGFADLVARFGALNSQQQKYLQRLKQTSSKLHDMIGSLVNLAWIEAGMPLEHSPIRLNELIQKAVKNLEDLAKQHQVGIAVSVQTPLPIVMGDAERLQLVVHHLLHNAIIYSDPEDNIAIHAWGDTHEIYCSVADQGIGIIDSEVELIFDRMYRSRDERVRDIPGGGLGLTVARTIIKRHGGDIWASSNYDEGSTFTFVLPAVIA
jgi:PAS domain S-box-containing protein